MAVLRVYQEDLLKVLDESKGLPSEVVDELYHSKVGGHGETSIVLYI